MCGSESECGNISLMIYVLFFDCKYICCMMEVIKRILLHSELNTTAVIAAQLLIVLFERVIFAAPSIVAYLMFFVFFCFFCDQLLTQ